MTPEATQRSPDEAALLDTRVHFNEMLARIQRRSNMDVRPDQTKLVFQKFCSRRHDAGGLTHYRRRDRTILAEYLDGCERDMNAPPALRRKRR